MITFAMNSFQDSASAKKPCASHVVQPPVSEVSGEEVATSKPSLVALSPVISSISTPTLLTPQVTSKPIAIKQEIVTSSSQLSKRDPSICVPSSSSAENRSSFTVVPSKSPLHIEIKKEPAGDELVSPQPKTSDALDTPNSVSGDSSCGSILDAQGRCQDVVVTKSREPDT